MVPQSATLSFGNQRKPNKLFMTIAPAKQFRKKLSKRFLKKAGFFVKSTGFMTTPKHKILGILVPITDTRSTHLNIKINKWFTSATSINGILDTNKLKLKFDYWKDFKNTSEKEKEIEACGFTIILSEDALPPEYPYPISVTKLQTSNFWKSLLGAVVIEIGKKKSIFFNKFNVYNSQLNYNF